MGAPAQALVRDFGHVRVDAEGVAWIEGTTVKVLEVVLERRAHGWSPEEVHFQHPDLSLAQIYAALAYYHDHKSEMDEDIDRRLADADASRPLDPDTPLRARLRAAGRLE